MSTWPVLIWTDVLVWLLVLGGGAWLVLALRREYWRVAARQVAENRMAMVSLGVVLLYITVGLLDSFHFRDYAEDGSPRGQVMSVLDVVCAPLMNTTEKTYSAPLAVRSFKKESISEPGSPVVRGHPYLDYAGKHLPDAREEHASRDIAWRVAKGVVVAIILAGVYVGAVFGLRKLLGVPDEKARAFLVKGFWVAGFLGVVTLLVSVTAFLAGGYHPLGTDKAGSDVLYVALKSVRTGLVIGTLTTLIVTPFAVLFGVLAGYLGGWVDAAITYFYATLGSIPWILLVIAGMMILNLGEAEEETFRTADKKLLYLCTVMGLTSWAGLCRLIRGEVLKLREVEYVQAAEALGAGRAGVMLRHLVPNVMHIVLISVVLRFSGLVLAEAVLAYIGIGVDPSMQSWGNMINAARLELAQDPIVWWQLAAAFVFMLGLVLPANLLGDAVRDALDPRLRTQ
ncbi:MAG: ABC transporter permease [Planctomycetota bacterium]